MPRQRWTRCTKHACRCRRSISAAQKVAASGSTRGMAGGFACALWAVPNGTCRAGFRGGGGMAKILVVDDAAFMRIRAVKVLHDNGYEVVEADNGAEAVRQYATHWPDAVLLDIT